MLKLEILASSVTMYEYIMTLVKQEHEIEISGETHHVICLIMSGSKVIAGRLTREMMLPITIYTKKELLLPPEETIKVDEQEYKVEKIEYLNSMQVIELRLLQ